MKRIAFVCAILLMFSSITFSDLTVHSQDDQSAADKEAARVAATEPIRVKLREVAKTGKLPPEWEGKTDTDIREIMHELVHGDRPKPANFYQRFRPASKKAMANTYIVQFTYDVTIAQVEGLADEIARDYRAKKGNAYGGTFARSAWFSEMSAEQAKKLSEHPKVRFVEQAQEVTPREMQFGSDIQEAQKHQIKLEAKAKGAVAALQSGSRSVSTSSRV